VVDAHVADVARPVGEVERRGTRQVPVASRDVEGERLAVVDADRDLIDPDAFAFVGPRRRVDRHRTVVLDVGDRRVDHLIVLGGSPVDRDARGGRLGDALDRSPHHRFVHVVATDPHRRGDVRVDRRVEPHRDRSLVARRHRQWSVDARGERSGQGEFVHDQRALPSVGDGQRRRRIVGRETVVAERDVDVGIRPDAGQSHGSLDGAGVVGGQHRHRPRRGPGRVGGEGDRHGPRLARSDGDGVAVGDGVRRRRVARGDLDRLATVVGHRHRPVVAFSDRDGSEVDIGRRQRYLGGVGRTARVVDDARDPDVECLPGRGSRDPQDVGDRIGRLRVVLHVDRVNLAGIEADGATAVDDRERRREFTARQVDRFRSVVPDDHRHTAHPVDRRRSDRHVPREERDRAIGRRRWPAGATDRHLDRRVERRTVQRDSPDRPVASLRREHHRQKRRTARLHGYRRRLQEQLARTVGRRRHRQVDRIGAVVVDPDHVGSEAVDRNFREREFRRRDGHRSTAAVGHSLAGQIDVLRIEGVVLRDEFDLCERRPLRLGRVRHRDVVGLASGNRERTAAADDPILSGVLADQRGGHRDVPVVGGGDRYRPRDRLADRHLAEVGGRDRVAAARVLDDLTGDRNLDRCVPFVDHQCGVLDAEFVGTEPDHDLPLFAGFQGERPAAGVDEERTVVGPRDVHALDSPALVLGRFEYQRRPGDFAGFDRADV